MIARSVDARDGGTRAIKTLIKVAAAIMLAGLLITARTGGAVPRASATALDQRVFGLNMGLFDSNEQLLSNAGTRQIVAGWHSPVIRIPTRSTVSDSTELLALQTIKAVGSAAMINVHGAVDANALADDTHLLALAAQVFGSATVYVEYGNEEDLSGVSDTTYTTSWNAVVPSLKALHPTYKFMGPVNFQKNPGYIGYFVGHAVPAPDIVSWHEYVCGPTDATSICLTHIANWATHVSQTNAAEVAAAGHTFPFMITEWNMDPLNDPRYLDPAVIQPFTTQALQELSSLVPSGLVGAQQYCVDSHGGGFELIDSNNALTPQGQAFQAALSGATLPPPPPPASPTPTGPRPLSVSTVAAPGTGDAPVTVTFTGAPAGGTSPYTSSWTFGDGSSSSDQSPKHTYSAAGTYTATLKLSDSKGQTTQSVTHITVYPAMNVTPTVNASPSLAPLIVSFKAAVQGGLAPYKLTWSYGDGSSDTSPSPTHSYAAGTFQVSLTVTDSAGGTWTGPVATVTSRASGALGSVKLTPKAQLPGTVITASAPRTWLSTAKAIIGAGDLVLVGSVLWLGLAASALIGMRRLH